MDDEIPWATFEEAVAAPVFDLNTCVFKNLFAHWIVMEKRFATGPEMARFIGLLSPYRKLLTTLTVASCVAACGTSQMDRSTPGVLVPDVRGENSVFLKPQDVESWPQTIALNALRLDAIMQGKAIDDQWIASAKVEELVTASVAAVEAQGATTIEYVTPARLQKGAWRGGNIPQFRRSPRRFGSIEHETRLDQESSPGSASFTKSSEDAQPQSSVPTAWIEQNGEMVQIEVNPIATSTSKPTKKMASSNESHFPYAFTARQIRYSDEPLPIEEDPHIGVFVALLGSDADENLRFCDALFRYAPALSEAPPDLQEARWIRRTIWPDKRTMEEFVEAQSCGELIGHYGWDFARFMERNFIDDGLLGPTLLALNPHTFDAIVISLAGLTEVDMAYVIGLWDAATSDGKLTASSDWKIKVFRAKLRSLGERGGDIFQTDAVLKLLSGL